MNEEQTDRRLDLAARAAWMSYARNRTQDQIAQELQVSRQVVQRLIALAHRAGLIEFRLKHTLTECIELAETLKDRFGLRYCEVAPNERVAPNEDLVTVGALAAQYLETVLPGREPLTLGVGNGKTMREVSNHLGRMDRPNCRCVSMMGNLTRNGKASHHDVVTWMANRLNADCYPRPMPVVTETVAECEVLKAQPGYARISELIAQANLLIMGIGHWGRDGALVADGFITEEEAHEAVESGAVGEFLGFAIDAGGAVIEASYHARLTSYFPEPDQERPVVIVASGHLRVAAVRAALTGRLANGLVTDENTARLLIADGGR
ncbi:sugar-binding transcriptional regulator [Acuticoccus kandeliae]|uniref:sugar-binding transcriptional regulator n=1 Tax=Acuticoccus kandeliae TaxID=2073160 RepID=UPI001475ECBA|nr:sugar-binding transcriptional regulator [Acuticoccus kandeliae]